MSTISTQISLYQMESGLSVATSLLRTSVESDFSSDSISVSTTEETVSIGDIISPRQYLIKLVSGDDLKIGFATGNYTQRLSGAGDAVMIRLNVEDSREISSITCGADTASSLSGDYFDIYEVGDLPVRVWFNMVATAAFGTLTLSGNAVNNEAVVLGGTTYTFKTALTPAANEVLIGVAATNSIDNLIAAITAGSGSGTLYGAGTTANASATAAAGAGDTMVATALTAGTAGNSIASTETMTNGSWGAATLAGGTAASSAPATPGGGRLLPVVIAEDAANTVVAAAVQAAIDADASFVATVSTATVTVTDLHAGTRTNITDGTTGWTMSATQQGAAIPSIYLKSAGTSQVVVAVAPN